MNLRMGLLNEAYENFDKAHELDPKYPIITSEFGRNYLFSGKPMEAH